MTTPCFSILSISVRYQRARDRRHEPALCEAGDTVTEVSRGSWSRRDTSIHVRGRRDPRGAQSRRIDAGPDGLHIHHGPPKLFPDRFNSPRVAEERNDVHMGNRLLSAVPPARKQFVQRRPASPETLFHFGRKRSAEALPFVSEPLAEGNFNQFRTTFGYGDPNRKGWNAAFPAVYDLRLHQLEFGVAQATYNTDCCGISFQIRRVDFGTRNENQYLISFSSRTSVRWGISKSRNGCFSLNCFSRF